MKHAAWIVVAVVSSAGAMSCRAALPSPERLDSERVAVTVDQHRLEANRSSLKQDIDAGKMAAVRADRSVMVADKLRLTHDVAVLEADASAAGVPAVAPRR